ncbi:hypothetical protein [Shouchella tritolerans]|uniref:hypothetical protein n=1 Tax=Shouchella tritolerans TaxID=2979466 RepID=UPI0021E9AB9A|nr:hypothetical protein [Shouchella tritolerans]
MQVNAELYEFLAENETGLYQKGDKVIAYVHVYFFDLDDFVKIVGPHPFDEGGMEVHLFENTAAIELNDIIENEGHYLSSYKKCFDEYGDYEKDIKLMEAR